MPLPLSPGNSALYKKLLPSAEILDTNTCPDGSLSKTPGVPGKVVLSRVLPVMYALCALSTAIAFTVRPYIRAP